MGILGRDIQVIERDECIALMEGHPAGVGRLVLGGPRPDIFPINFAVDRGDIVFRTAPGTKLDAAIRGAYVAFEVDWVDPTWKVAWSVVVRGWAQVVHDRDAIARAMRLPLFPWAKGRKEHLVKIEAESVTGRRVV